MSVHITYSKVKYINMRRVTVNLKIPKSLNKSFEIILLIYHLLNHPRPRSTPDYNEL